MKTQFLCPYCDAYLRIQENIIFKVITEEPSMGILLLNPELGNYAYVSSPELKLYKGDKVTFMCPVCNENLEAREINKNLVCIKMIDEEDKKYNVYFSSIVGEHTTFKIEKDNVVEKYGEDSSDYLDYFSQKLKRFVDNDL